MTERGRQQQLYPTTGSACGIEIQREISTVRCRTDEAICDHQLPVSFSSPSALESSKPERVRQQIQNLLSSMTSAEHISNYWNIRETSNGIKQQENVDEAALVDCQKLSTQEVMQVAGMQFIQMHNPRYSYFSSLMLPSGQSMSGMSERDITEVELVLLLLSAADKVGQQQFDQANALLSYYEMFSSKRASPVQRVVLYFAQGLRERIDKATRIHQVERMIARTDPYVTTDVRLLKCHTLLPHLQIAQFAAIQAAVDNTATARRIHVIDLALRSGTHLAVLMQALSKRKTEILELLKVTAVNTFERGMVEESGRRLADFAESMGVNFSFNVILVNDIADVKGESFDIEDGEAVVVYASMALMKVISRQDSLDRLTRVFGTLNPSAMVITEIEANLNAPPFVSRFTDALFFYSSVIDCLDTCVANEKEDKMLMEQHLRDDIKNILSTDDHERTIRNVKVDVWRAFFTRHRMVEVGLSESSLDQAKLVAARLPYGRFSMLTQDGKCLLVGWKGTPLLSLSVWKFR